MISASSVLLFVGKKVMNWWLFMEKRVNLDQNYKSLVRHLSHPESYVPLAAVHCYLPKSSLDMCLGEYRSGSSALIISLWGTA